MMTSEEYNDKPTGSDDGRDTTDSAIDAQPIMLENREKLIFRLRRDNVAPRIERDAALASDSAAYARGVHDAAALVARCLGDCWHLDDEKVWPDDMSAMIRALADAPPAPVVGVKP